MKLDVDVKLIWLGLVLGVLSGCATLNGTAAPPSIQAKSVVFINKSIVNTPIATGAIRQIDEETISTYWTLRPPYRAELEPGFHRIIVSFYSLGHAGKATVEANFEPGRVYEISARLLTAPVFEVTLNDVTREEKSKIYSMQITGHRAP